MPLKIGPEEVGFDPAPEPGEKSRFRLAFEEQIAFFRGKEGLKIPTEHWDDIRKSAHDRAFMVAGAAKADLLTDLYNSVERAVAEGKSIGWFRKEFDLIVEKHGWSYKGGRDWRTRVIYTTNLSASYAAGRFQQLTDPDLIKSRPYWQYVHSDSVLHPRPLHVSWNGLTLRHDDPWWQSHFPPNGWGCRCRITAVSDPTPGRDRAPDDGTYIKKDRWGNEHVIPKGIDYGWDYQPGAGLDAKNLSDQVMAQWQAAKGDAWELLSSRDWASYARPSSIPLDASKATPGPRVATTDDVIRLLRDQIGGDEKVYSVGGDFAYPVMVNAETLGHHIDPARARYVPYLGELLTDPFEVWAMFQRHKGTGKIEMRVRIIKRVDTGDKEGMLLVAQATRGIFEAWTFVPAKNLNYLNKQRQGVLVYGR
jgi:hypothetical protein